MWGIGKDCGDIPFQNTTPSSPFRKDRALGIGWVGCQPRLIGEEKLLGFVIKCVCLQCVWEREAEQGGCHHWQILSPLINCATKAYRVGAGAYLHPWALSGQLGKVACIYTEACSWHLPHSGHSNHGRNRRVVLHQNKRPRRQRYFYQRGSTSWMTSFQRSAESR